MEISLTRVILYVRDVRRLSNFYCEHFGLSVIEDTEGWALLQVGLCELGLHRVGEAFRSSSARASTAQSNAKLVLTVQADVEALRTKLIASGVTIGAIKSYPGFTGLICDGVDPEGNVFQLSQA